jgi:hypothetical protein
VDDDLSNLFSFSTVSAIEPIAAFHPIVQPASIKSQAVLTPKFKKTKVVEENPPSRFGRILEATLRDIGILIVIIVISMMELAKHS